MNDCPYEVKAVGNMVSLSLFNTQVYFEGDEALDLITALQDAYVTAKGASNG